MAFEILIQTFRPGSLSNLSSLYIGRDYDVSNYCLGSLDEIKIHRGIETFDNLR